MIEVTVNKQAVNLPTRWDDISWNDYLYLYGLGEQNNFYNHLCYFLKVQSIDLNLIKPDYLIYLHELLSYLMDYRLMVVYQSDLNISLPDEAYKKFAAAKQTLEIYEGDYIKAGERLVLIYADKSINAIPVTKALGYVSDIYNQFTNFSADYVELAEHEEKEVDKRARNNNGNDLFNDLGLRLTLYNLSKGDVTKWKEILEAPAVMIQDHLLVAKRISIFEENREEILKLKNS